MMSLLNKLKPIVWLFFFISTIVLFIGFYYLFSRIENLSKKVENLSQETRTYLGPGPSTDGVDSCGEECLSQIEEAVASAVSTISGETKTVVEKTTVVTESAKQTSYIPLGSTGTTTSTDWVDVEDSAVYIDLENDYVAGAVVSWESSLKVAHGNGKAFARLYDDTNKIAVDFSEFTTENNATFKLVTSGNLPLWRGRNLYKVQIKSLNSFEVTYSGGRIKISY